MERDRLRGLGPPRDLLPRALLLVWDHGGLQGLLIPLPLPLMLLLLLLLRLCLSLLSLLLLLLLWERLPGLLMLHQCRLLPNQKSISAVRTETFEEEGVMGARGGVIMHLRGSLVALCPSLLLLEHRQRKLDLSPRQ